MKSMREKPDWRQRDDLWPLDADLTVALALMVFAYLGFVFGWIAAGGAN